MIRIKNVSQGYIDYRLNIMGIRVWWDSCQLIAKKGEKWETIGPKRNLPVALPDPSQSSGDELHVTAFQLQAASPESDLAAVLGQSKSFHTALHNGKPRGKGG
jgi:hypothetical protein